MANQNMWGGLAQFFGGGQGAAQYARTNPGAMQGGLAALLQRQMQMGQFGNNPFFQNIGPGLQAASRPVHDDEDWPGDPERRRRERRQPGEQDPMDEQVPPGWTPPEEEPAPQDPLDEVIPGKRRSSLYTEVQGADVGVYDEGGGKDLGPYDDSKGEKQYGSRGGPSAGDEEMVITPPGEEMRYGEDPRYEMHNELVVKIIAGMELTPEEMEYWQSIRNTDANGQGEDKWWDALNQQYNAQRGITRRPYIYEPDSEREI